MVPGEGSARGAAPAGPGYGGAMPKTSEISQSDAALHVLQDLPVTKEATTSRVLLNNPLMRVVTFAFDAGQVLTEHTSPRAVACTALSGTLRFIVDGTPYEMSAGDLVYLAPGARHAVEAITACHLQLVMVDTEAAGA